MAIVLAALGLSVPALAQEPADMIVSSPSDAAPAETITAPDTAAPLSPLTMPPATGDDEMITNLPAPISESADPPPAMPQVAPDAAAAPAAPDVINAPQMAAPEIQAPAGTGAETNADPLAPFRAQQAILEAEQRRQQSAADPTGNPLGPAAQLPVGPGGTMQSPEELQAQLELEAAQQQERIKQQIFDASVESLLPLTPEQTREVLESFRISREAAETPITVPTARTTVENVSLDPSSPPLIIQTSPGYVTTLTILDMTGAPWAIQDISWAGKFEITTPEEGGHVIRITPMTAHGVGNISIRLVDLITPITFSIATGLETVDYRFDARIPKPGPLAKTPLMEYGGLRAVAGADENLMRVLDGTAVPAAERLSMDGVDGATSAYRINDTVYLRTPLTLLSPAWQTSATSADGMNVYTLRSTPIILLSDRGRMVKAKIRATE